MADRKPREAQPAIQKRAENHGHRPVTFPHHPHLMGSCIDGFESQCAAKKTR
jgi:hypothetical protein